MIEVIDNLLSPSYNAGIETVARDQLSYRYQPHTSYLPQDEFYHSRTPGEHEQDYGQFASNVIDVMYFAPVVCYLQDAFGFVTKDMIRQRVNILTQQSSAHPDHYNGPHEDHREEGVFTALYYLHDGDGDTFFFNEKYESEDDYLRDFTVMERVPPKRNRAVLFDSRIYHASSNPIHNKDRIVMSFIMEIDR